MAKLPKIKVNLDLDDKDTPTLCSDAKGATTDGDPDVVNPPVVDADLHNQADKTLAIHNKRVTDKSETLTKQEIENAGILRRMYSKVGRNVEDVANDVAVEHGSVAAGEDVVVRCGFKLKKKAEVHPRGFEIVASGPGWIHLRVKSLGKNASYMWRNGRTTAKGVKPEKLNPVLGTRECDVFITDLASGVTYGYQFAIILPVPKKKTNNSQPTLKTKTATLTPELQHGKPTFKDGDDPFQWSDFIYDVAK